MRLSTLISTLALVASSLSLASPSHNGAPPVLGKRRLMPAKRHIAVRSVDHPDKTKVHAGFFEQPLDHRDPSKGTFLQRYWWDAQHWKGPGSPVFLFNVGETDASSFLGYLHNSTLPGRYASEFGGAAILIEHRYWGKSTPFYRLDAETLQYLDIPQAIWDMTNFAKNVQLTFDPTNGTANAASSPWVLVGGSYPGALAAWTQQLDPGVFWAYHATSAVVQAIYDFHMYFDAVAAAIPQNCTQRLQRVIAHVDDILSADRPADVAALKHRFGLVQLTHHDDFVQQIATPLWQWQSDQQSLYRFCDALHEATSPDDDDETLAILDAYASYINTTVAPMCQDHECDTYVDPDSFNLPYLVDGDRQWSWMLCHNPLAYWQVGPPPHPSSPRKIVSSHLRPTHWQRLCPVIFPATNGFQPGSVAGFTPAHLNLWTGGWDAPFDRVIFVVGEHDPWNAATPASAYRPGGPRRATERMPMFTVPGGMHVPDLVLEPREEGREEGKGGEEEMEKENGEEGEEEVRVHMPLPSNDALAAPQKEIGVEKSWWWWLLL